MPEPCGEINDPAPHGVVYAQGETKTCRGMVGKNQAGEWLRINLLTVSGWVYFEMVEISGDLSEIPVISQN